MSPSNPPSQPLPLLARKKDIACIAILSFITFLAITVDFAPYYPSSFWLSNNPFFEYYITAYKDPLYTENPLFWRVYVAIELVFTMPTAVWGIHGLVQGDNTRALPLFALATHVISSCFVGIAEIWASDGWAVRGIHPCLPGHFVHLFVWCSFWFEMYGRLGRILSEKAKTD